MTAILWSYILVEVRGAMPEGFLNRCATAGIPFWNAKPVDDYTLRVSMPWRDWKQAKNLSIRSGCDLRLLARKGLPVFFQRSRGRVFFFTGLLVVASLLFLSSLFIWEIDIQGCNTVSEAKILNTLEECGVKLGAFWPTFNQDLIRSEALLQLPELHWITVNNFGSRATVLVKERVPAPKLLDKTAPTALIATRDGIVDTLRVTEGRTLVEQHQTVLHGQELVSAVMPGFRPALRLVHASGEVYARTWHESSAVAALSISEKVPVNEKTLTWSLLCGNHVINIFQNASQKWEECDKITIDHYLEIPGLFRFPVGLRKTVAHFYDTVIRVREVSELQTKLEEQLLYQLQAEIGETGEIQDYQFTVSCAGDRLTVTLLAECREQIAVEHPLSEEECRQYRQQANSSEITSE